MTKKKENSTNIHMIRYTYDRNMYYNVENVFYEQMFVVKKYLVRAVTTAFSAIKEPPLRQTERTKSIPSTCNTPSVATVAAAAAVAYCL